MAAEQRIGFIKALETLNRREKFFPDIQPFQNIVRDPDFNPALNLIRERTQTQSQKGLLLLPESAADDPRDILMAAQSIQTRKMIISQIDQLRAENKGGIIMLLGGMGAGKTSTIARTASLLISNGEEHKIYCNQGETQRFKNSQQTSIKTADGLTIPVHTSKKITEIKAKPGDAVFLIEALFQLFQDNKFDEEGFGHLLKLVNQGVIFVVDSLAYFSNTAPMPIAAEILKRLDGSDISLIKLLLFAKCSLDPTRFASQCYPLYRSSSGEIEFCHPEKPILEVTDTADPKRDGYGFLPVSLRSYLDIAKQFDKSFEPRDDSIFWKDPQPIVPLLEAVDSGLRKDLTPLLELK